MEGEDGGLAVERVAVVVGRWDGKGGSCVTVRGWVGGWKGREGGCCCCAFFPLSRRVPWEVGGKGWVIQVAKRTREHALHLHVPIFSSKRLAISAALLSWVAGTMYSAAPVCWTSMSLTTSPRTVMGAVARLRRKMEHPASMAVEVRRNPLRRPVMVMVEGWVVDGMGGCGLRVGGWCACGCEWCA